MPRGPRSGCEISFCGVSVLVDPPFLAFWRARQDGQCRAAKNPVSRREPYPRFGGRCAADQGLGLGRTGQAVIGDFVRTKKDDLR